MFTLLRWTPPEVPDHFPAEIRQYLREQNRSIAEYLRSLENPDALSINEAEITASNGIIFPSGTMADYNPTSWTPTITAGTGSITTVSATGVYTAIGREYFYTVDISITTNGTGATSLRFDTPFTAAGVAPFSGFETNVTGIPLGGYLNGAVGIIVTPAAAYPGGSGYRVIVRGSCYV